jgi:hypothetical protein
MFWRARHLSLMMTMMLMTMTTMMTTPPPTPRSSNQVTSAIVRGHLQSSIPTWYRVNNFHIWFLPNTWKAYTSYLLYF